MERMCSIYWVLILNYDGVVGPVEVQQQHYETLPVVVVVDWQDGSKNVSYVHVSSAAASRVEQQQQTPFSC